jgi:hypothetical protein
MSHGENLTAFGSLRVVLENRDTLETMAEFEIQVTGRPNGGRLSALTGPLTLSTLFDFQNTVRKVHTDLVIDLAGVPYMDSACLGAILGAFCVLPAEQA